MGGSDRFNTKTNNQIELVGFLINRSDPTDGEDLNRTEPNHTVRFGSVGSTIVFSFLDQILKISK